MPKSQGTITLGSKAEDLFNEIFTEVFGIENTEYLSFQQSFVDYYGNYRYIDFDLENEESKIAIEIDGELWHNLLKYHQKNIMMIY